MPTMPPSSSSSAGLASSECFRTVTALLDGLGVRRALAGAGAAARYRASDRVTTDLDFLVEPNDRLVDALTSEGFSVRTAEDEGEVHLVRARNANCAVDFIVAGTAYQHLAIERARGHVLTVEDVLVHKLIAWRPRDRDDVRSILSTGLAFDREYVDHWAREWSVDDRWRDALSWRG